jgi:hypothetical protein
VSVNEFSDFEIWFSECVLICVHEHIGPDDYEWNLHDCKKWVDRFEAGLTSREAVTAEFGAH